MEQFAAMTADTYNGKWMPATERAESPRTAWENVGIALLFQAVADLKLLCGYGLITKEGRCKRWPRKVGRCAYGHKKTNFMILNGVRDPFSHKKLKAWFLTPGHAQQWCDLLGWPTPASEMFWRIVQREGANK